MMYRIHEPGEFDAEMNIQLCNAVGIRLTSSDRAAFWRMTRGEATYEDAARVWSIAQTASNKAYRIVKESIS